MNEDYLVYGLNALSRAYQTNYFADGHCGAAIIAAYYLSCDFKLDQKASDIIKHIVDISWSNTPLCASFPIEKPDRDGADRIIKSIESSMDHLRQIGHNVILPTMALKAFNQLPEMLTPSRTDGICKLIEKFIITENIIPTIGDKIPKLGGLSEAAEFILTEWLNAIRIFDGQGQGWSGHLLTYGKALLDLRQLGYGKTADQGEYAFGLAIKRIRMGPLDTDPVIPEHNPTDLRPHQRAYWEERKDQQAGLGHIFKYPYAFYGLMAISNNVVLKEQCMQAAYHIF